jgi:hypothetical protein
MFASFATHGDLFKGLIMLHHFAKIGLPPRVNSAALPCLREGRHTLRTH